MARAFQRVRAETRFPTRHGRYQLKESAALDERLAERAKQHHLDKAEVQHRENASRKMEHVARLQAFIAHLHADK